MTKAVTLSIADIKSMFPSPVYEQSIAKGIPIAMLEQVRGSFKEAGIQIRVKYRGPRTKQVGFILGRYRTKTNARQTCLKGFATHFSIYL